MRITTRGVLVLASLLLASSASLGLTQDTPAKKPAAPAAKKEAPKLKLKVATPTEKKAAKDPFAIPADASPEELMKFLQTLTSMRPNVKSRDELIEHFTKVGDVMIEVTGKVLDSKDADDEIAVEALGARFEALMLKGQLGEKDATKMELELATKYSTDPRKTVAKLASEKLLFAKLKNIKEIKEGDQEKLLDEALTHVKGNGKLGQKAVQTAAMIGSVLEESGNDVLAAKAYEKFAELFGHTGDEKLESAAKRMIGMANRLQLIGKPIAVEGELVNGDPIDWAAYKGKVVLVDFWATWCGPCIAELPNVKSNYIGYHSKGFDIVGVSLDDDKEKLEKFIAKNQLPWANLFSAKEDATGWEHPLAAKYGVTGIPFTVLVGKDGNVIKMNVRGPELREALQELLGPPDEEAIKAAEAEEEKAAAKKSDEDKSEDKEEKDSKDE